MERDGKRGIRTKEEKEGEERLKLGIVR